MYLRDCYVGNGSHKGNNVILFSNWEVSLCGADACATGKFNFVPLLRTFFLMVVYEIITSYPIWMCPVCLRNVIENKDGF